MIITIITILVISNIVSWAVIMRLISEVRRQDIILEGLSDVFKEMSDNVTKAQ